MSQHSVQLGCKASLLSAWVSLNRVPLSLVGLLVLTSVLWPRAIRWSVCRPALIIATVITHSIFIDYRSYRRCQCMSPGQLPAGWISIKLSKLNSISFQVNYICLCKQLSSGTSARRSRRKFGSGQSRQQRGLGHTW